MQQVKAKKARQKRRHMGIRRKVVGSADRPRLVISRSLRGIYAQVIDDDAGKTLAAAGSDSKELREAPKVKKTQAAEAVGKLVAEKAIALGIKKVSFDRAGYKFHGRVKALADSARKAGLKF